MHEHHNHTWVCPKARG